MSDAIVSAPMWAWIALVGGVAVFITLDLLVMHRRPQAISTRAAMAMIAWWVSVAAVVGGAIWWGLGSKPAMDYASAYLVEQSLSVDNVFVFAVIFQRFGVPAVLQPRVLFWGILGAILMRGACIAGGIALLSLFSGMLYIFGAILLWTAWKMLRSHGANEEFDPGKTAWIRLLMRVIPMSRSYASGKFFERVDGKLLATPLLLVLLVTEGSDVLFAVDSIPAALAITQDPFIVFSSNLLAILGLRAMYFAVAGILRSIPSLHIGLTALIGGIGIKMILGASGIHIDSAWTFAFIALTLGVTIGHGLMTRQRTPTQA